MRGRIRATPAPTGDGASPPCAERHRSPGPPRTRGAPRKHASDCLSCPILRSAGGPIASGQLEAPLLGRRPPEFRLAPHSWTRALSRQTGYIGFPRHGRTHDGLYVTVPSFRSGSDGAPTASAPPHGQSHRRSGHCGTMAELTTRTTPRRSHHAERRTPPCERPRRNEPGRLAGRHHYCRCL